ncbi:MAG: aminotransferase class I/II-fold pyridoxal phosphate-dependent enzyme [Alphaproteobacteria bacterium]|nr:aminotransferase class I/II-fold pyridoxal phosphate-dependent enzyme [Alphaproteobacteria bacterium]
MKLPIFKLEDYLCHHEFTAPHLLCCSDAQTLSMKELVSYADTETLNAWENLSLGYTEVQGDPGLRADIASLYEGLTPDHIRCFAGAEEGIFVTFQALLKEGDHVIVFTPCYQSLRDIPRSMGCDVTTIDLREENDWRIDLNALEDALRPDTKLVIMNTPHNPTGQVVDQATLEAMIDLLRNNGTYLFSDEVYFHLGPTTTTWPNQVAELYERGISLNVMSKAYGLPGLRMGWIASQDKALLKQCEYVKHYLTICNAAPSEVLSRIAIRARDRIIGRNNHIIDQNTALFEDFLKRYSDVFSWVKPVGGCTGFVRYHGDGTTDGLAQKLIGSCGVLIMPSSIYDAGTKHFRIGLGRQNFSEGLSLFEREILAIKGESSL